MPTVTECCCCQEVQQVCELMGTIDMDDEVDVYQGEISCITDHPGFRSVCLSRYTLDVAGRQYEQQYGNFHAHSNR